MEADPATVLEWIKCSECRDLQITALEQLCTEILFSDNVDEFVRRYSYAAIISATTQVFADELAPDYLLEANARTLTYCLEMCDTHAIQTIKERDLRIMCTRLDAVDMMSEKSNEVGQQIVKMLELIANHIPVPVYRAGGLTSVLRFVQLYSENIHADVLQAGMNLVKTLCSHCEPTDPSLDSWIESLSALLNHNDQRVIDNSLQALASIVNRFARAGRDPTPVATAELIDQLSHHLSVAGGAACTNVKKSVPGFEQLDGDTSFTSFRALGNLGDQGKIPDSGPSNPALVDALTSLLLTLCCNSAAATQRLLSPENHLASTLANILLYGEDSIASSVFRLIEVLIYILGEGRVAETYEGLRSRQQSYNAPEIFPRSLRVDQEEKSQLPAVDDTQNKPSFSPLEREAAYRAAVEAIRKQDKEAFDNLLSNKALDLHHLDNRGQTLLNWASSFGTPYMVEQLCLRGADVQAGARTSLDYAAGFGRVEVCELLLKHGANPNVYDVDGLRPIDRARLKRDDPNATAVIKLLEGHSSQAPFGSRTPSLSPHTTEWRSGKTTPVSSSPFLPETLFLFAVELLPVLITLFGKTQSEVVKYQTILLVRRLVGSLNSCDMQTLSDHTQDGLRLGFRLSRMIYTALAEEPEEAVLCALQLAQQLLCKTRSVYLPIFQRIGLIPMLRGVYEVLKHGIDLKSLRPRSAANTEAQPTEVVTDGDGQNKHEDGEATAEAAAADEEEAEEDGDDDDDEETEAPIEHSELLHFEEGSQEQSEAPAQEEEKEEEEQGQEEEEEEKEQEQEEEEEKAPETTDENPESSGQQEAEGEQEDSATPTQPVEPEPIILSNANTYSWQNWVLRWFGNLFFIFNDHAMVQLEINCPNGELRGIAMTAENGLVPIELRPGIEPLARSSLRADLLRLYHRMRTHRGSGQDLFDNDYVPYFDTYRYERKVAEHEKLQRSFSVPWLVPKIGPTRDAAADSSNQSCPAPPVPHSELAEQSSPSKTTPVAFRRYLSSPAESAERNPPLEAFVRRLEPSSLKKPFPSHAKVGSLQLDVVKGDDDMHYLRVFSPPPTTTADTSSPSSPEMLLFPAYGPNGFLRLRLQQPASTEPKSSEQIPLIREHQVHYRPDFLRSLLATEEMRSVTTTPSFRRPASEMLGLKKAADEDIPLIDESQSSSVPDSCKAEEIAFPRQPVLVDGKNWEITFHSGKLNLGIPQKSRDGGSSQNTTQESSTQIRHQIHNLAWRLLSRELVSTPSTPSAAATPQTPAGGELQLQPAPHDRLCVLRDFATEIARLALPGTGSIESVTAQLEDIFRRIAALLSEGGEEALTAYEVITSGLVNALLLCLAPTRILSWASAIALKPEESQDPSVHLRFLQARRLAFCHAFMPSLGGTGISSLVRRLVEAFDQTQRLPLNLFERIQTVRHIPSRKIKNKPVVKPEPATYAAAAATAVDSQSKEAADGPGVSQKQPAPTTTAPPSSIGQDSSGQTRAAPSTAAVGGVVFTFQLDPTDDSAAAPMSYLPLGLLCPRSQMWELTHRSLNGGGVRALLDRQVNFVLGEFVPASAYSMCTGRLGMLQLQQGCPLLMERGEVAIECDADGGGGRLRLARMANHTIFVTTLTSIGRLRSRVKELTAKYWYQLPRTEMAFFRMFTEKPHATMLLVPSPENEGEQRQQQQQQATPSSPDKNVLSAGVIDWLGTDAGGVPIKDWVHPLNLGLIQALPIPANVPFLGCVADAFVPQLGRSGSKPSRDKTVGLLVGSTLESWPKDDAEKKSKKSEPDLGPGIVVDLGVQLIPSAYSLAPLRGKFHEPKQPVAPRNWCLQASNNGQDWVTLRTHVNDAILNPEVDTACTWSLDPSSATPWLPQKTQSSKEDVPEGSAPSTPATPKENATQAVPHGKENVSAATATTTTSPPGWRVYRLMATGPNNLGTCAFPIGSLELYGRIVGVHEELLSPSDINGHRRRTSPQHGSDDSGDPTRPSQSSDSANNTREDTIPGLEPDQNIDLTQPDSIRQLLPSWWRRLINFGAGMNASHLESLGLSVDHFGLASKDRHDESDDDDEDEEEDDAFSFRALAAARDSLRLPLSELLELIVRDPRLPRRFRDSIGPSRKSASVDLLQPLSLSESGRERAATVDIPDLRSEMRRRRRRLIEDAQSSQYASASDRLQYDSPATVKSNHLVRDSDSLRRLSHATEFISCSDSDDAFLETDGAALEFAEAVDALVQMNTDASFMVTTVDAGESPANQPPNPPSPTSASAAAAAKNSQLPLASGAAGEEDEEEEEAVTLEDVFANLSDEDKTVDDSDALLAANSDIQADGDNDTDNDEFAEQVFGATTTASADVAAVPAEETGDGPGKPTPATGDSPSSETDHGLLRRASPEAEGDNIVPETVRSREGESSPVDEEAPSTRRRSPRITETVEEQGERRNTTSAVGSRDNCINEHNNLAPGLIPAFDPNPRNRNASASSEFILRHPPGSTSSPDACAVKLTQPDKTQLVITLKAYLRDGSLVASIRAKDNNRPIFNYFFQLAEKVVYWSKLTNSPLLDSVIDEGEEGAAERLTVRVNYRFRTPEDDQEEAQEEEDGETKALGATSDSCINAVDKASAISLADTPRMLTDRDIRLATFQDECIRLNCPQKSPGELTYLNAATSTAKVEQLLELIRVIYQISGAHNRPLSDFGDAPQPVAFCTPDEAEQDAQACEFFAAAGLNNDLVPEHFISPALSRKLIRQLMDPLAVVSSTMPDWCLNLPRRLSVLFPYEVRLNLFHSSAFGAARSVIWLQTHVAHTRDLTANTQRSHNRHHSIESSMSNRFRNNEAARLAAGLATYLVGAPRCVRTGAGGYDQLSDLTFFTSSGGGGPRRRRTSSSLAAHQATSGTVLSLERLSQGRASCDCTPLDIGRLHKEFIQIPRDGVNNANDKSPTLSKEVEQGAFWEWADRVLDEHASRKSELEIQFIGEQGTGIGPTLEFFSLVAAELRRKSGRMWVVNEEDFDEAASEVTVTDQYIDSANTASASTPQPGPSSSSREEPKEVEKADLPSSETKAYVKATNGLFPAPYPPNKIPESVVRRFHIMGIAVAKSLQDNRRIDLPLSTPFLKLISAFGNVRSLEMKSLAPEQTLLDQMKWFVHSEAAMDRINLRSIMTDIIGLNTSQRSHGHWITGLLDFDDFWSVDPERGRFFYQLCKFCQRKRRLQAIFPANGLTLDWLENAAIDVLGCKISDLSLEMEFIPSGQYSAEEVPLLDHYSWEQNEGVTVALGDAENQVESVTVHNVETYIRRTLEYCLDKGIRAQMDAFRDGFERVFRMDWLALFSPHELGQLICGDSDLSWTREELLAYTVPSFGFTQNSATFQFFISVLVDFNLEQRRAFLRFVTGCSSLPPGGLRNLSPRLRVVRKDAQQGPFPSVNTCAHYLKLPEYNSQAELCQYLLAATKESGFFLN